MAVSHSFLNSVGSISDIELAHLSGFLKGKDGISILADCGFTIKILLKDIGIEWSIPPFIEGHDQLLAKEVQDGRHIASVRIYFERAIDRIKTFSILYLYH